MHPADIQAALKKKHITQKEIAKSEGVSDMAVSLVINKVMISDHLMKAIARKIGKEHWQVFPEYYLHAKNKRLKKAA